MKPSLYFRLIIAFLGASLSAHATLRLGSWVPLYQGVDHAMGTNAPGGGFPNPHVAYLVRVDLRDPDIRLFSSPRPEGLAEGAASGPPKACNNRCARGCAGTRTATVSSPAVTSGEIPAPLAQNLRASDWMPIQIGMNLPVEIVQQAHHPPAPHRLTPPPCASPCPLV